MNVFAFETIFSTDKNKYFTSCNVFFLSSPVDLSFMFDVVLKWSLDFWKKNCQCLRNKFKTIPEKFTVVKLYNAKKFLASVKKSVYKVWIVIISYKSSKIETS